VKISTVSALRGAQSVEYERPHPRSSVGRQYQESAYGSPLQRSPW